MLGNGKPKQVWLKRPLRDAISEAEVKLIADRHYAEMLHFDDEETREGTGRANVPCRFLFSPIPKGI